MKEEKDNRGKAGEKGKAGKAGIRILAVAFWLLVWQLLCRNAGLRLFVASPLETVRQVGTLAVRSSFWKIIGSSTGRILAGFLPAVFLGTALALLCASRENVKIFIMLPMRVIRTVPVVSFIILALLLVSSRRLCQTIAFTMALPTVYLNVLQGMEQCSKELDEMARMFRLDRIRKLRYVIFPQVFPYFLSGSVLALGFAWKSGVAAEVIGMPAGSIGERLQQAKIYLDTSELFAWTAVIVVLGVLSEKMWRTLLKGSFRLSQQMGGRGAKAQPVRQEGGVQPARQDIRVIHLDKFYDGRCVWKDLSAVFPAGSVTAVRGASGSGKTTLLRILSGLEKADGGIVEGMEGRTAGFAFQEDRLLEHLSAVSNICLALPGPGETAAREALLELGLSETDLSRPVRGFSGGMKRRVSLARAVLSSADILLLDEPFRGLDERSKQLAALFIEKHREGRTVIYTSHEKEILPGIDGGREIRVG